MDILIAVLVCLVFAGLLEFRDWRAYRREKAWRLKVLAMKRATDRLVATSSAQVDELVETRAKIEELTKQVRASADGQASALEMIHKMDLNVEKMISEYELRIRSSSAGFDYVEGA